MATKVFMVRHQHHGMVTSHVFTAKPSDAQVKALADEAARIHSKAGWTRIVEADLLGPEEMPPIPEQPGEPSGQTENKADKPKFVVTGVGTVTEAPELETIGSDDVGMITSDEITALATAIAGAGAAKKKR